METKIQASPVFDKVGKFAGIWLGIHHGDETIWEWRPMAVDAAIQ